MNHRYEGGFKMKEELEKIEQEKNCWEEKTLKPALDRFKLKESPTKTIDEFITYLLRNKAE